jgi:hypothetical protein
MQQTTRVQADAAEANAIAAAAADATINRYSGINAIAAAADDARADAAGSKCSERREYKTDSAESNAIAAAAADATTKADAAEANAIAAASDATTKADAAEANQQLP